MASLTDNKIKDTYVSLLKVSDNGQLDANLQEITDGVGNNTGIQLNTAGDLTASGTVAFGSLKDTGENITVTKFVDEADGIANNDNDTSIPTSAAVKNYVDTNITAQDLDITDGVNVGAVDLDSQLLTFTGAGTVTAVVSNQTVTITGSATDLSNTPSANDVVVESSDGNNTTLAGATTSLAGVMTSADKTKLNGIEAGAEVNPTASEVKTLYESNADTNAFTDAEQSKLSGIESGAEVNTVDSVNTQTGAVVLDADDIDDSTTTNKFTTQTEIDKLAGIESGAQVNTVDSVNGATGVVVLDADDIDDTSTTNKFVTSTDVTKLSNITITQAVDLDTIESDVDANTSKLAGIENGADVTDATNVAAAGAMMTNVALLNDLADVSGTPSDGQVLTYDSVNGWQPEAPGSAPVTSVNTQTGAVVLDADDIDDTSTTHKFSSQTDIDKLAGIEAGAEVNTVDSVNTQTGAVVLDADDIDDSATTNKFTTQSEIDKLAGIEAGAEVNTVDSVNSQTGVVVLDADDIDDTSTTNKFTTQTDIDKLAGIEAGAEVNTVDSVNGATGTVVLDADDIDDTSTTNKFTNQTDIDKLAGIEALADVTDATNVAAAGALMDGVAELADLADVAATAPSDGQVLTYDTVNGWQPEDASGGIDGSGTADYVPKWSDSDTLTDSSIYESAGNVGINMIPAKTLDLQNTDNLAIRFYNGASFKAGIEVATTAGDMVDSSAIDDLGIRSQSNVLFATGGNFERIRITSGGEMLFNSTTYTDGALNASIRGYSGQIRLGTNTTANQARMFFTNPNGAVGTISTSGSSTIYATSSDYRLKEDLKPISNALDRVDSLEPINFAWKADGSRVDGFLAHQVAEVIPEAITGEKDGVDKDGNPIYQGIDQSKLVPLLVGAIQELSAKVAALESQLNA
jgi:hypothetical protein